MNKKISSLSGVDIKLPKSFNEFYNTSYKFRFYGEDNLYPQQVKQFYRASPTLNKCVNRMAEHLFGEYKKVGLLTEPIVNSICLDYALFGGFALHINYNAFGDIDTINYVPFETIRLCEQNKQGLYTRCYYCADWSSQRTANTKKIDAKKDKQEFFIFTDNVETRLKRMEQTGAANYPGEILYLSNTISYPSSIEDILPICSMECGIINALYRDVRTNCFQSMIVSIPRGDDNADQFAEDLKGIQGDINLGKIALYEYASSEEKPELLNLSSENYDSRFENSKTYVRSMILGHFKQEVFSRIEDGSVGFDSGIVNDAYTLYNFSLRPVRKKIVAELKRLEPAFEMPELKYLDNNEETTNE